MQLFSYHVIDAPRLTVATRLIHPPPLGRVTGLHHGEFLLPMKMGHPVARPSRYEWNSLVFFGFWDDESCLERFLEDPPHAMFERPDWHMRLRFYRRWGSYSGLAEAKEYTELAGPKGPVAAVTLARLRLRNTVRFTRWGKPVEAQVRDSPGMLGGTVAFRPTRTFSTFSVWRREQDMLDMVHGERAAVDGEPHRDAMIERAKRPFHREFTTMRFVPLSEHGRWPGGGHLLPTEQM